MIVGECRFDAGLHRRIRIVDSRGEDQDQCRQAGGCSAARYADCFVCSGKLYQLGMKPNAMNAYLHVCWGAV